MHLHDFVYKKIMSFSNLQYSFSLPQDGKWLFEEDLLYPHDCRELCAVLWTPGGLFFRVSRLVSSMDLSLPCALCKAPHFSIGLRPLPLLSNPKLLHSF